MSDLFDSDSEIVQPSNIIRNIVLKPARLILSNTNMATITLSEIKHLTEIIPTYNGDIRILNNYLNAVDEVQDTLSTIVLTPIQKTYLFGLIKAKLSLKAAELLAENKFLNWEELKDFLKTNFDDKANAETILLEILQIKNKNGSENTLDAINHQFLKYKSKIALKEYSQLQKNAIIKETQKLVVSYFFSLLPNSVRGSFVVKNPSTL